MGISAVRFEIGKRRSWNSDRSGMAMRGCARGTGAEAGRADLARAMLDVLEDPTAVRSTVAVAG